MGTELSIFDNNAMQAPAHIADAFDGASNIQRRQTVPSLSYEGKVWTVSINGDKQRLTRQNEDGDEEPLSVMRVVILDAAQNRGRTYYEGAYDPDNVSLPTCWSDDGKYPDASIENPQHHNCAECPLAAKGSKITEQGKQVAACSQHRMLAVVPAGRIDSTPLRLKIAVTSDFDKQSPDEQAKGWYAFSNYTDFLLSRGIQHTAQVVTKIKFDQSVAYPKLFFSPDRWLDANEVEQVKPLLGSPEVTNLLGNFFTPNGTDGAPKQGASSAPAEEKPAQAAEKPAQDPKPAPDPKPAQAAEKPAQAAETPAQQRDAEASGAAEAQPASETSGEVSMEVPDDVAELLKDWGDD
jgi:hypothetical protein